MKRLSMVLALLVWTAGNCAACSAADSLFGCIHDCFYGKSCACGDSCGCGDSCSCSAGSGCCDTCNSCGRGGCAGGCEPGGICDCIVSDCPVCQGARNSGLFQRYCGPDCGSGCDDCGMRNDYDCSACRLGGHCYGYGLANRGCGGCNAPYGSGCCAGPGCCASGDQNYNFAPGPPVGQTAYPYYTTHGPRDFLDKNPAPIGPY